MKPIAFLLGSLLPLAVAATTARTKVAILGGGVSGINAARNLTAAGIEDFVIIEARDTLGGKELQAKR